MRRSFRPLNDRLIKNVGWLALLQLFNYAAPLVVLPVLTRLLSLEDFGALSSAMAAAALALIITDYGFNLSATLRISENRSDKNYIQALIKRVITAKVFLLFFGVLLVLFVANLSAYRDHREIFYISLLSLTFQTFHCPWFYQGLERMRYYVIYMAATKILYVLLIIIFFINVRSPTIAMACWAVANFIGMIISLFLIRSLQFKIGLCRINDLLEELKYSSEFFYSRIALAIYSTACTVILGANNLHQAALYSAAENALKAGQALTSALSQALLPFMANKKDWAQFWAIILRALLGVIIISAMAICFSRNLVQFAYGDQFSDAAPVLQIMMLIFAVNFLNVVFGYPAFSAIGQSGIANRTMIFGCAAFCTFMLPMVGLKIINAVTIAMLYLLTELIITTARVSILLKKLRSESNSRDQC